MSVYRAQAHFDAPEVGDVYTQVVGIAGRRLEYSRIIDRREEFKELRWHCPTTGGFQHWLLTDAHGGTFRRQFGDGEAHLHAKGPQMHLRRIDQFSRTAGSAAASDSQAVASICQLAAASGTTPRAVRSK
jgi:hypothetical protein